MKTLKRTLCMVLIAVMMMGLMAVAANAAFKDDDKIQYTTAVGVMSGLGILNGRDTGNFDPADPINRAEIAKILYCAMTGNGYEKAAPYASANTFKDVKSNIWYAGVINAIADKNVVLGYEGKYRPEDNITGYEVLMAALRALGYDNANSKEITNSVNWQISALSRAEELSITAGVADGTDYSKNCTRELACQLLYNAFMKNHVTYSKDSGEYTAQANTSFLGTKYNYTGTVVAADKVVSATYNSTSKTVVATTASGKAFAASYADVGHVYNVYTKADGTVIYAEKISKIATITKNDVSKATYTIDSAAKVITNAAQGDAYTSVAENDVVVYVPAANANAKPVIYSKLAGDTMTIEKVTITTVDTGANKGDMLGKIGAEEVFKVDADTAANNVNLTNIEFATYKAGDYYFVAKHIDGRYELTATNYVEGKVTAQNAASYTIGGTKYDVTNLTDNTGIVDAVIQPNVAYRFLLADGKVFAVTTIDGQVSTNKESAYIYGTYVAQTVKGSDAPVNEYGQPIGDAAFDEFTAYALGINATGAKVTYKLGAVKSAADKTSEAAKAEATALTSGVAGKAYELTVSATGEVSGKAELSKLTTDKTKISVTADAKNYYYNAANAYHISVNASDYTKTTVASTTIQNQEAYIVATQVGTSANYTVNAIFYTSVDEVVNYAKDLVYIPANTNVTTGSVLNAAGTAYESIWTVEAYVNGTKTTITSKTEITKGAEAFYKYEVKDGYYTLVAVDEGVVKNEEVTNVYTTFVTTASIANGNTAGVTIVYLNAETTAITAGKHISAVWNEKDGFTVIYVLD